ncbi:hypothetical protein [Methylorubrum suomiense]|uniref:Uncharacterized protein n=1 Tax=Methylorubrum suomiense TaxID=144191 RepID=A0ABQ4V193_9HYPH|nr:hypothetical protein [Methylorubrum suomiense]GJE78118.1 hypothetical protein BGCPKDLD_4729 [Methylorubrum suomiense]
MVQKRLRAMGLNLKGGSAPPPRPGWETCLVAQRPPSMTGWPEEAAKRIAAARACYEAGTHEMFTVMTPCRWTQLYLRPRRTKAPSNHYFTEAQAA